MRSKSRGDDGMTHPVIHRVTHARSAPSSRGRGRSPKTRRAEIDGAFRGQAAREAENVERPRAAGAQSGVCRRALQRQLFRDRFRELPGLARLGLSRQGRVQRLWHGRAALRRRRVRARRNGPAYLQCRAHLFSVRHARSRRHQGRRGRYIRQRRARARGRNRPDAAATTAASRIGTASSPARRWR